MVSEEILNEINEKLSDTSTIISSAYAKIYSNDFKSTVWKDSQLSGVIVLIVERSLQTVLIRLYDIDKFEMVFETEMYYNFKSHCSKLSPEFYSFPISGGQLGINFVDSSSGTEFFKYISIYSPKEHLSSRKSEHKVLLENENWLEKLKKKVLKKKETIEDKKMEISKPYAVQMVSHVEWDDKRGVYILDSLPGDLRRIFVNDEKLKSEEGSLQGEIRSHKTTDEFHDVKKVHRATNRMRKGTRFSTFEQLEEEVLGSKIQNDGERPFGIRNPTVNAPQSANYYKLLASKISERKAELDKYNPNETESESGSNL
ncbi:hypothetical protein SteCoe_5708 [Stentor coeruleus]|uniref:WH1 domain-containing protein n=1 Tax=Stentor coeruleus TaxID=5963 RepID=A0A1R2CRR0_9CILI|nr:hypothetical protein SteCoe_5708 [Stentor coeruleus]